MAITGKNRIELRLEEKLFKRVMDVTSARGVCSTDAARTLESAKFALRSSEAKANTARAAADREQAAKNAEQLKNFVAELTQDLNQLEARSPTKRKFPACVYPSTGEYAREAGQETRFKRRGTAYHEQFHAAVRNIEAEHGLDAIDKCLSREAAAILKKKYGEAFTLPYSMAGRQLGWADHSSIRLEEVLARAEEIRKSCRRSVEDCDSINRFMESQMHGLNLSIGRRGYPKRRVESCTMLKLAQGIERDFAAPTGVYRQAAAKCSRKP
jgi:hypothetical protein